MARLPLAEEKDTRSLLQIETLLIICQNPGGATCGRLIGLGEDEVVFTTDGNLPVADRFSAGFRWDGGFINIDELEKIREDNGGRERVIRSRILDIGAREKSAMMKLLNDTRKSAEEFNQDYF